LVAGASIFYYVKAALKNILDKWEELSELDTKEHKQANRHNRTKSGYIQHILEISHSYGALKDSLKLLYIYINWK
jgi:hypothetical protein